MKFLLEVHFQNIPLEIKKMSDYCLRRVRAVSQEALFLGQMAGI